MSSNFIDIQGVAFGLSTVSIGILVIMYVQLSMYNSVCTIVYVYMCTVSTNMYVSTNGMTIVIDTSGVNLLI